MPTLNSSHSETCRIGDAPTIDLGATAAQQPPTQQIDSYEILKLLGQGAMGKVYLAQHRRLLRKVALKVLPQSFDGKPNNVDRFTREMAAIGRLDHPT